MIYLGYDIRNQRALARYDNHTIICQNNDRATEILNGLIAMGEKLPENQPISCDDDDGDVEVILLVQTPWMYQVQYSDQAWEDLLSVEEAKSTRPLNRVEG